MSSESKKKRLSAIDYFIIFAVAASLISAGLRVYETFFAENGSIPTEKVYDEYLVSFRSTGMRSSSAKLLDKGDVFYLYGGETEFGSLEDNVTVMPAEILIELQNGELVKSYAEENGDNTRVDVNGTFRSKASRTWDNLLFIEGKQYVAPNYDITLYNNEVSLTIKITGIEKVS